MAFYVTIFIFIVWILPSVLDLRFCLLCLLVLSPSPAQSLMMTMTSPCSLGLHCGPSQLLSLDSRTQPEHKCCAGTVLSDVALPVRQQSAEIRHNGGRNPGCWIIRSFPFMAIMYNSNMLIPSKSTH